MRKLSFLVLVAIVLLTHYVEGAANLKINKVLWNVQSGTITDKIQPGNFVGLSVYLENTGDATASTVTATISESDDYAELKETITATDPAGTGGTKNTMDFPGIGAATTKNHYYDSQFFGVSFPSSTPSTHAVILNLRVNYTDSGAKVANLYFVVKMGESSVFVPPFSPTLTWTEESDGYKSDGIDPDLGHLKETFTYRIKYTDWDNDAPSNGYPRVFIKKAGVDVSGSPFTMTSVNGTSRTGAIYTYSTTLKTGNDYTYYFEAKNATETVTTSLLDAPDVNVIVAGQDSVIMGDDGTEIRVPKDTLNAGVTFNISNATSVPEGIIAGSVGNPIKSTNVAKEISASDGTKTFTNNIRIKIPFTNADVSGLNKSNLKLFYYNNTDGINLWALIPSSTVDTANNTITVEVNHMTIFKVMAIDVASAKMVLYNNLFNPAKGEKVYFKYDLTKEENVNIVIYNIIGQRVKELLNDRRTAGSYTDLTWDGSNDSGEVCASGTYIVYIITDEFNEKKKCIIAK
jgi:hypothetical protein